MRRIVLPIYQNIGLMGTLCNVTTECFGLTGRCRKQGGQQVVLNCHLQNLTRTALFANALYIKVYGAIGIEIQEIIVNAALHEPRPRT